MVKNSLTMETKNEKNNGKKKEKKEFEKPIVAKTVVDLQRLKLQKLMKNPVRYFYNK